MPILKKTIKDKLDRLILANEAKKRQRVDDSEKWHNNYLSQVDLQSEIQQELIALQEENRKLQIDNNLLTEALEKYRSSAASAQEQRHPNRARSYAEVGDKQRRRRELESKTLLLAKGLAKDDSDLKLLVQNILSRIGGDDNSGLDAEIIDHDDTTSEDHDEPPWLLHGVARDEKPVEYKYLMYSADDKLFVLTCLQKCNNESLKLGFQQLQSKFPKKFDGINADKIKDWRIQYLNRANSKKRGKQINVDFENDVLSRLVLCEWREHIDMTGNGQPLVSRRAEVIINVTYSYEIVRKAAVETKNEQKWLDNQQCLEASTRMVNRT